MFEAKELRATMLEQSVGASPVALETAQTKKIQPWTRRVSNLRPLACEASALPLSYASGPLILLAPPIACGSRERGSPACLGSIQGGLGQWEPPLAQTLSALQRATCPKHGLPSD